MPSYFPNHRKTFTRFVHLILSLSNYSNSISFVPFQSLMLFVNFGIFRRGLLTYLALLFFLRFALLLWNIWSCDFMFSFQLVLSFQHSLWLIACIRWNSSTFWCHPVLPSLYHFLLSSCVECSLPSFLSHSNPHSVTLSDVSCAISLGYQHDGSARYQGVLAFDICVTSLTFFKSLCSSLSQSVASFSAFFQLLCFFHSFWP